MSDDNKLKTILVIDDDPSIAELISDFCDGVGYKVYTETNSVKALEKVKAVKPDLITLDLQMPAPDGFDLLRAIKSDPSTRNIPVLIVSVVAGDAERQGLLAAAQAIFSKPINFNKFRDKIEQFAKSRGA